MSTHKAMPLAALILSALIIAAALAAPGEAAAPKAADPFEKLKGDWKGGGTVVPSDGEPKKVSCKVTYKVAGRTTTQRLRCAGNDYSINATTKMTDKGGKIRGFWLLFSQRTIWTARTPHAPGANGARCSTLLRTGLGVAPHARPRGGAPVGTWGYNFLLRDLHSPPLPS